MKKRFNTTGICRVELHYMMDTSKKMDEVMKLVEFGEYFTINRPRQFGKTTTLQFLGRALEQKEDYLPIRMSFQGVDEKWHTSDEAFSGMFMNLLSKHLKYKFPNLTTFLKDLRSEVFDMDSLSSYSRFRKNKI